MATTPPHLTNKLKDEWQKHYCSVDKETQDGEQEIGKIIQDYLKSRGKAM